MIGVMVLFVCSYIYIYFKFYNLTIQMSFPFLNICQISQHNFFFFFFGCTASSLLCGLSLVTVSGNYSLVVHRLLVLVASLVTEHRL